jgi:hypothetical protein
VNKRYTVYFSANVGTVECRLGLSAFWGTISAALEAVSTFGAVAVSLVLAFLAHRSSRTRIRAKVGVTYLVQQQLQSPRYVTVTITNIGQFPATIPIPFLSWKVPFYSDYLEVIPLDYDQHHPWVRQHSYPTEIKPRASETFFLSELAGFRTDMAESTQRGTTALRMLC